MRCEILYTDIETGEGLYTVTRMDPPHIPQIGTAITFESIKGMFEVTDVEYRIMDNGDQIVRVLCGDYLAGHHRK